MTSRPRVFLVRTSVGMGLVVTAAALVIAARRLASFSLKGDPA